MINLFTDNYSSTKPRGYVGAQCNGCRKQFVGTEGFAGKAKALANAIARFESRLKEDGWTLAGDHHYCDRCKGPAELPEHEAQRISELEDRMHDLEQQVLDLKGYIEDHRWEIDSLRSDVAGLESKAHDHD